MFIYFYAEKESIHPNDDDSSKYSKIIHYKSSNYIVSNSEEIDSIYTVEIFKKLDQIVKKTEILFGQKKKNDFVYFSVNICNYVIYIKENNISYDYSIIKSDNIFLTELEKSYLNLLFDEIKKNKIKIGDISEISVIVTLPEILGDIDTLLDPDLINSPNFDVDSLNTSVMKKIDSE